MWGENSGVKWETLDIVNQCLLTTRLWFIAVGMSDHEILICGGDSQGNGEKGDGIILDFSNRFVLRKAFNNEQFKFSSH